MNCLKYWTQSKGILLTGTDDKNDEKEVYLLSAISLNTMYRMNIIT